MKKLTEKEKLLQQLNKTLPLVDEKHIHMLYGILMLNNEELKNYIKFMIDCLDRESQSPIEK